MFFISPSVILVSDSKFKVFKKAMIVYFVSIPFNSCSVCFHLAFDLNCPK